MNRAALLASSLALLACAHRAAPPVDPPPGWPDSERPRVVWTASLSGEESGDDAPWWRRLFDVLTGEERSSSAAPPMLRPFAVVTLDDRTAVADPDGGRVLSIDPESGDTRRIPCPGEGGTPIALAAEQGALWIADAARAQVLRWSGGRCDVVVAAGLERPTGLALTPTRLFVVDPPRHQVIVFTRDGRELLRFGGHGDGAGQLNFPTAIAAAREGSVWVVDALHFRLVRFSAEGAPLEELGARGDEAGLFARPKGVAVDDDGRVYVTDAQRDLVLVFSRDGQFEYSFASSGTGPGELALPAGIALTGGRIFVADSHNQRVQIFARVEVQP